jgi:hypothetical protein
MVLQTSAGGSDTDAQQRAIAAIRAAFASAVRASGAPDAQAAQLTLSGPGVFAVAARAKIERAAIRLSIASSILVVTLLFAVYRSLPALALGMMPVATGALTGIAAVALGFGAVHGITLGFGITLIGESVDYSIYFFIASRSSHHLEDAPRSWQRTWWPTVRLGMLTSVCGFASRLLDQRIDRSRAGDSVCVARIAPARFRHSRCVAAGHACRPGAGTGETAGVRCPRRLGTGIGGAGIARIAAPSRHAVESRTVGLEPGIGGRARL